MFTTNIDELAGWQTVNGSLPEGSRPLEDYADAYVYDLAGNRVRKTTDYVRAAAVDEAIEYLYDGNDRLLWEELDLGADESVDKTTRYEYGPNANVASDYGGDWTVQSKKAVFNALGTPLSTTSMSYDLQGRLGTTTMEAYQSDGVAVARRDVTTFDYDHTGIRVRSGSTIQMWDDSGQELLTVRDFETEYLVDHENFTGYEQVLAERTVNVDGGWTVRTVVYTVGHDVIGQWSQGTIAPPSLGESSWVEIPSGSHLLLYDGHGSTRILARAGVWNPDYDVAWLRHYAYDTYGIALGFDPGLAATNVLYSGEVTQVEIDMQYVRARYYDMATGRWNRLDPFAGNMNDPLSLHKYLYVHGDPINGIDPTGMEFTLVSTMAATSIRNVIGSMYATGGMGVLRSFYAGEQNLTVQQALLGWVVDTVMDPIDGAVDYISLLLDAVDWAVSEGVNLAFGHPEPDASYVQVAGTTGFLAQTEGVVRTRIGSWLVGQYNSLRYHNRVYLPDAEVEANHLNQKAAFQEKVRAGQGLAINLQGGINDAGSQHQQFHIEMERFWKQYRKGGRFDTRKPTVAEYNRGMFRALKSAGLNQNDRRTIMALVRGEQAHFRVGKWVPNVPDEIMALRHLL